MRLGLLAGNEALKAIRRRAFWLITLGLAGVTGAISGAEWWQTSRGSGAFVLPDAWTPILSNTGPLVAFFSAVLVILLTGSEFQWKTARQNVIDGLSRDEFFVGKLLLLLTAPLLLSAVNIGVGGAFALASGVEGSLIGAADLGQMFGAVLMALGLSAIAFLAVFVARSNGAAVGLFFLWFAILEQLIGVLVSRWEGWGTAAARWLPGQLFTQLLRRAQWDTEVRAATAQRLAEAGRPAPEYLDTGVLVGASSLWIVALVVAAWWLDRRRDL